jgi:ABC-type dipeptide/oligopeptide/nickel transport system permease component
VKITWYLARRVLLLVPVLLGVSFATFALTHVLPGNPVAKIVGPYVSPAQRRIVSHQLGLDRPFYDQYLTYVRNILHGNLGRSLTTGQSVVSDLSQRLGATFELMTSALLIALAVAIPLGVLAALKRNTWIDAVAQVIAVSGISVPIFWSGIMLSYVLFYKLGIAPAPEGRIDPSLSPPSTITGLFTVDALLTGNWVVLKSALAHLWLPASVMGFSVMAPIMRIVRQGMVEALASAPILALRSLGISPGSLLFRHALKNALLPVITMIAVVYGYLLGGSVLIESIFAWPGMGLYAYNAISSSDFVAVQGFILYATTIYVTVYFVSDVLYLAADPRVKY